MSFNVFIDQQTVVKQDLPSTRKPEADVPSKGKSQPTQTTIKKVVTVVTMPEKKLAPKEDPVPIVPPQKAEKPKVTSVVSASLASVKAKNAVSYSGLSLLQPSWIKLAEIFL